MIKDVKSFCERNPEVEPVLENLKVNGEQIGIDQIACSIRAKSGTLQYPEAIFLLIKEYQEIYREASN